MDCLAPDGTIVYIATLGGTPQPLALPSEVSNCSYALGSLAATAGMLGVACRYMYVPCASPQRPADTHLRHSAPWLCMARTYRVWGLGSQLRAGAIVRELDLWALLRKRARLVGSTLRARTPAFKAALIRNFAADYAAELQRGDLRPAVDKVPGCSPLAGCDDASRQCRECVQQSFRVVGNALVDKLRPALQRR